MDKKTGVLPTKKERKKKTRVRLVIELGLFGTAPPPQKMSTIKQLY
jgi:hypothetical protein